MRRWKEKIGFLKKEQLLILILVGALMLVIAIPSGETETVTEESEEVYEVQSEIGQAAELENRLRQILEQVEGIGSAKVMITLKSEGRKIVEKDQEKSVQKEENGQSENGAFSSQDSSSESTVYQKDARGNEIPYVTEEIEPEIEGVLVIAQGASDPTVECEITEAVMALFGIEAHKIKVMKMK